MSRSDSAPEFHSCIQVTVRGSSWLLASFLDTWFFSQTAFKFHHDVMGHSYTDHLVQSNEDQFVRDVLSKLAQWNRTGSRWSPVRTLPVVPLWCGLGFILNSRGNKAAANFCPMSNSVKSHNHLDSKPEPEKRKNGSWKLDRKAKWHLLQLCGSVCPSCSALASPV